MLMVLNFQLQKNGAMQKKEGRILNMQVVTILTKWGWFFNNSKNTTHPVATKKANGYGLYDMQGNVSEWCLGSLKGLNWSNEQRSVTNIGQYNIIGFRLARNVE